MRYKKIKNRSEKDFKRLTGVPHQVFKQMVAVLNKEIRNFGRPPKLSREDQLLMTLEYLREYRTYFHIAKSYGISESSAYKNICWVENVLIKHPKLALPGKKALLKNDEAEMIIQWLDFNKINGEFSQGLFNRRADEIRLYYK